MYIGDHYNNTLGKTIVPFVLEPRMLFNVLTGETTKTSVLSSQLKAQLNTRGVLLCKNELELSSTVGQGVLATALS